MFYFYYGRYPTQYPSNYVVCSGTHRRILLWGRELYIFV